MQPVILDQMPEGLLDLSAAGLHRRLDGPTLIHLPGRRPQPLFVSVLQHGNEDSGWEAVRRLLRGRYGRDPLPRSMVLLICNVQAAARGQRRLPDQPDFNRCWPGGETATGPWHELFARITDHARALRPIASIDIHNNTGQNPHYAAINRIEPQRLRLATLFSRTVIHFTRPAGVQAMAFGEFCPAVTLECGLASEVDGADHAMAYLDNVLNLETIPDQPPAPEDLELFEMVASIRIADGQPFGFGDDAEGLALRADLEQFNFRELPPGTGLGRIASDRLPLTALTRDGRDIAARWFEMAGDRVVTSRPLMPAMLTTDARVVSQDCLCYLMERVDAATGTPVARADSKLPETRP